MCRQGNKNHIDWLAMEYRKLLTGGNHISRGGAEGNDYNTCTQVNEINESY